MNKRFFTAAVTAALCLGAASAAPVKGPEWLGKAIFYQIYPSSFQDSDGDGIGDIPGIISRLDYVQGLGVNVLWLNPVFESGWFDGGYDVIDFYKVDPRFGTNTDLVRLVEECHARGLRICLDLVAGHTSDQCAWFRQSAGGDRNQRYSDWYIWTDEVSDEDLALIEQRRTSTRPDRGRIGRFVEADAPRAKYFLKNYYECQPALNFGYAHPVEPWQQSVDAPGPQAVRRELRNILDFWFSKGVDGFRVDMAGSLVKNDEGFVETMKLWQEMRAWMDDAWPDHALVSEWSDARKAIPCGFNADFYLPWGDNGMGQMYFHTAPDGRVTRKAGGYFSTAGTFSADCIHSYIDRLERDRSEAGTCGYVALPTSNHDFQRPNNGLRSDPAQLKVFMAFVLTQPTIPFLYYGDEIGLRWYTGLPDVEGSELRAGSRTPMQWDDGVNAGFSAADAADLYLPVMTTWTDPSERPLTPKELRKAGIASDITVASQEADPGSLLNWVKALITLRQDSEALGNDGGWEYLSHRDGPLYPMVYARSGSDGTYVVALNPGASRASVRIPDPGTGARPSPVLTTGKAVWKGGSGEAQLTLAPVSAAIWKVR